MKAFIAEIETGLSCDSSSRLLEHLELQVLDERTVGLLSCFCFHLTRVCMAAQTALMDLGQVKSEGEEDVFQA